MYAFARRRQPLLFDVTANRKTGFTISKGDSDEIGTPESSVLKLSVRQSGGRIDYTVSELS